jgi:putative endonuclease
MNTTLTGRKAEAAARAYLEMRGFKIIEQNYRRPGCEIDIIASKKDVIHFIEVKYRATDDQGGGLEAITPTKLRRMKKGAWTWVDEYEWRGEYVLSAVELAGPGFIVISFVENIF